MNRLALTATIGAVLVAAILGLIYAISKQDYDDTPEPTTQSQPAAQPANPSAASPTPAQNTTQTAPAPSQQPTQSTQNTAAPAQPQPAPTQTANAQSTQSAA